MRLRIPAAIVLACLAVLMPAASVAGAPSVATPKGFFGVAPQTALSEEDTRHMVAGGIESVRLPVSWGAVQPTRNGGYDWSEIDATVEVASRAGLRVLPFLWGTPGWLAGKPTTLPLNNSTQRAAWAAFVGAAVKRYGPGGEFWATHAHEGVYYEAPIRPPLPIRTWQIWNEANFFYFAYPVSPSRYAQLLKLSSQVIKGLDPSAKVILTGLFGKPTAGGKRGMPASTLPRTALPGPGNQEPL